MERVPEPELMDDPAQVLAYAAADFAATDAALVERLSGLCGGDPGPRLLDLGCGPGNISFHLAQRWPRATVLGLDGSAAMLELARQRQAAEPQLAGRLHWRQARLPLAASEAPLGRFSALVSNSLLHHLHDPQVLWGALAALAAPRAWVLVRDLRRPADPAALEALVTEQMAGAPAVLQRDYRASLAAAFTPAEVRAQLDQAGLGSLRVAVLPPRYLEVWGAMA